MFLSSYSNFSYSIETPVGGKQDRAFTVLSNDCKTWAKKEADLLSEFMASKGEYNNL
jgi:hypothetical protein